MYDRRAMAGAVLSALLFAGCTLGDSREAAGPNTSLALDIPARKPESFRNPHVAKGVEALKAGKYREASAAFNFALKDNPQNAYIHFLNALSYHLMTRQGDASRRDLAEVGYLQALQFDPNGWWAAYGLGVLKMEEGKYRDAQDAFAKTLLVDRGNVGALQGLAIASYYAADFPTARAAIGRALKARPDDPAILRSGAFIAAANGQRAAAAAYADRYAATQPDAAASSFVHRRIAEWADFLGAAAPGRSGSLSRRAAALCQAIISTGTIIPAPSTPVGAATNAEAARPDLPAGTAGPQVLVDVTYIRSEDQLSNSQGVNLLNGLQLQYGYSATQTKNSLSGIGAFEQATGGTGAVAAFPFQQTITRALTLPTVTYSLNIFNSQDSYSEVVSRPTLIAQQGQPSSFFSGDEVMVALAGQYGGNLNSIEVGVNVDVTPTLVTDDQVTLRVRVKESGFDHNVSGTFQQQLQVSNTYVNATVTLGYDQTVILSGLSHREKDTSNNRTPGLSDIPLAQYLFKNQTSADEYRSLLIMLTPHRGEMARPGAKESTKEGEKEAAKTPSAAPSPSVAELQQEWLRAGDRDLTLSPNQRVIVHSLQRQLRAGDLQLEPWSTPTFADAVRDDLNFLYY